jgi:hypothetical protein
VIAGVAVIAAGGLLALRARGSDNLPAAQVASGLSTAPPTAPPPTSAPTSGNGSTESTAGSHSSGSGSIATSPTTAPAPTVPGVAGLDGAEALSRLHAAGFAPEQVDQVSNRIAKGKAIRTDPPSGARPGQGAKVRLFVSAGPTPVFDLIAAAPSAAWSNGNGALSFNGSDGDSHGFAVWRDNLQLEDGSNPGRLLETHPEWVPDGVIEGDFQLPAPLIAGDHFSSRVGFLTSQTGRIVGEVDFEVLAFGGSLGDTPKLVTKVHDSGLDGVIRPIDVDLSGFAGATKIALRVEAGPTSAQDWAVWINPKVEGRTS